MLFMFPVIDLTTIGTIIELIIQIGQTAAEIYILNYLVFEGGWLDMLRLISFWLDNLVIKYIDRFYSYFDKLLNGKVFAPDVVERVMNGVFLFVAVIVLFKLIMLLIKYVTNPELVSDEKAGGGALVKRIVIGMSLMLFLNTIFDYGYKLQSAILNDNVFGKILLTKGQLSSYEKNKGQMGRVLGFNVYQAFWNLDENQVPSSVASRYKNAISARDPKAFGDINEKNGEDYAVDYFPVLSTVVLFYVLYLIIKYCIDIVVRMFKLFVLQMLGPIAITDYMINGDKEGMFKAWTKTTISAYAMLFMRVFCIWFVAFITTLMNQKCTVASNGVCKDSILYMTVDASGNATPDYLLRALITLGLLAFLMDLPKLLSEVFGLDLEQDASVKGLMGKVGGVAKMVGLGAVTAGGAAIGGAIGSIKGTVSAGKGLVANRAENKGKLDAKAAKKDPNYAKKMKEINDNKSMSSREKLKATRATRKDWLKENKDSAEAKEFKKANLSAGLKATSTFANTGIGGGLHAGLIGAMGALPIGKDAVAGYNQGQSTAQKQQGERDKALDETANIGKSYKKGMAEAANDFKMEAELTGSLTAVDTNGLNPEVNGQMLIDRAHNAGQQVAIEAVSDGIKMAPQSVEVKAELSNQDLDISPQEVKIEADVSADTSQVLKKLEENMFDTDHMDG